MGGGGSGDSPSLINDDGVPNILVGKGGDALFSFSPGI